MPINKLVWKQRINFNGNQSSGPTNFKLFCGPPGSQAPAKEKMGAPSLSCVAVRLRLPADNRLRHVNPLLSPHFAVETDKPEHPGCIETRAEFRPRSSKKNDRQHRDVPWTTIDLSPKQKLPIND